MVNLNNRELCDRSSRDSLEAATLKSLDAPCRRGGGVPGFLGGVGPALLPWGAAPDLLVFTAGLGGGDWEWWVSFGDGGFSYYLRGVDYV